jgi:single-strand DNA-binding protein
MSSPITLTGRLGQDPELRFSPSGTAIVRLSIVTSRRTKNEQTQEWSDTDTTWWDCTAFRSLAENCAESLQKGMAVVAVGRVVQENWEDKEGQKRSKLAVKIDAIGPDLTRATAAVQKANSQNQGGQQQRQGATQSQDPWSSSSAPAQGGGWGTPQGQQGSYDQSPPF